MANEQSHSNVKARILFTGTATHVIENLIEYLPFGYETEKCPPTSGDLLASLKHFRPHVAVICLQNETRNELKAYNILDNPDLANLSILAVGHKDDCEILRKNIVSKEPVLLGRPINMELFLSTLSDLTLTAVSNEASQVQAEEETTATDEKKKPETAAIPKAPENERQSILVVDDDTSMLNTIKLYLQDIYDVSVVPSGKLALKFLSKKHADLVLLDYLMPEMNGPEVLDLIRTSTPNPEVPVLFLTGVADKDMVLKTLEHKPNGYLLKPATREALLERVTELLLGL